MRKAVLFAALALIVASCSTRVTNPTTQPPTDHEEIDNGDPGSGGGGGPSPARFTLGTPVGHVIPIYVYPNSNGDSMRGFGVALRFSGGLHFSSCDVGPLLPGSSDVVLPITGGDTTEVDGVVGFTPCITTSGIWAYVTTTGSGTATLCPNLAGDPTPHPVIRNCVNVDLAVIYDSPASVVIN